ncbi:MAG: uroporphyrinogen-III C-methyltransferase [Nocardioidaceae bacterium]
MTYDLSLPVDGRAVTVVGGGGRAVGQVAALRDAGALVTVVAMDATAAIADLVERGVVGWQRRPYLADDLDDAWLVVAATGVAHVDDRVFADATARRLWCLRTGTTEAPSAGRRGEVILVGGGPGDPRLLTIAGRDAIARADVVVTDRLAPLASLCGARPDADIVDVSKVPGGPATPQDEINAMLVDRARDGDTVVRLKGGDGFVLGRGGEEVQACLKADVAVRVIPGLSSALAVPAQAGVPVTHRGVAQGFTVVSGHVPPDDPRCTVDYDALARCGTSLVLMMAVANLPAIGAALVRAGLDPGTPAVTIADGTLATERQVRATVSTIAGAVEAAGVRPPAVTVVGAVADALA